jgi:hypothetical protein
VAKIILLLSVCMLVTGCLGTGAAPTPALPTPVMTETIASPPTKTPVPAVTPTTGSVAAEEYAVYEAVIEWGFLTESTKLIVVTDHTAAGLFVEESMDERMIEYIRDNMGTDLQAETLNDYLAKNEETYELGKRFPLDVQYVLISEAELNKIFEEGEGWDQFYSTYPNSQGTMTLSRVGFNTNVDQALVYVGNQAHYLAGIGYYVLLAKEQGAWVVENAVMAWIS